MLTSQPVVHSIDHGDSRPVGPPAESRRANIFTDFIPYSQIRTLGSREQLFREGDEKTCVYQILDGTFVLYRVLLNGRRQVTGFAVAGDIVGLGTDHRYPATAESSSKVRVRALPVNILHRKAGENSEVGMRLYDVMSRELTMTQDHLVMVSMLGSVHRVAAFLLGLSKRICHAPRQPGCIELSMTRYDIADFLNLTTETVSRSLTKLVNGHIISRQSGGIRVLDHRSLQDVASGVRKL